MRREHFCFAGDYHPLNHGSLGAFPKEVQLYQIWLQSEIETEAGIFMRRSFPRLLKENRFALAPLLGADVGEVVLVPNATTVTDTVLRNLVFEEGDIISYLNFIHSCCVKIILALSESRSATSHESAVKHLVNDEQFIHEFRTTFQNIRDGGKMPKLAFFETIPAFPAVRFPWEKAVEMCKKESVVSFVDAAHGIGHIDLAHLGQVSPDFMVSNCYK